jgi:hypothetical protein
MATRIGIGALAAIAGVGLAACGGAETTTVTTGTDPAAVSERLPQGSEPAGLDPAEFTTEIDNEYWPMAVGSRWVYRETDSEGAEQKVVVTVLDKTKGIANGVEARVVRDVVTEDGVPVEVTDDWYAQDSEGNIWYLGEDTTEYEDGKPVSKEGSFEAGSDGAEAGVIMPADPQPGMAYRQEYYADEAEDEGEVVSTGEQAEVPAGHYKDVVMTKDTNPLEPKILEFKFFAPGVGPVLAVSVSGGSDREEMVSFKPGR